MIKHLQFLSLAALLMMGLPARSQNETQTEPARLIFGPEWTFTNKDLASTNLYATAPEFIKLKMALRQYCGQIKGCHFLEPTKGASGVMKFDEFLVHVSYDPGVIEIQSTPLSQMGWGEKQELIQTHVFDFMGSLGYRPHSHIGNGHLNIGLQYFADNPKLLRNFIVDYYNHPGLSIAMNTFRENLDNAKTFDQMLPETQEEFLEAVRQLDAMPDYTIGDVIKKMAPVISKEKYIALALREISKIQPGNSPEISDTARIEIRALRPQANMRDFLKVMKIFESRIHYLETLNHSLPFHPPPSIRNGAEAMWQYADYLETSKLQIKDFASLIPKEWRRMPRSQFARPLDHKSTLSCQKTHAGYARLPIGI